MLSSKAHSPSQQARLAITLAWIAGYTNVITILTCGTVTSHVTGTVSQWGRSLFYGRWALAGFTSFLLAAFLFGAILSGLFTETGRRRGWESIYVLPMAVQALLLTAFAISVELHDDQQVESGRMLYLMTGLASLAMGLQNATITRISNGVVRTTHMTGVFTDLGLEISYFAFQLWDRMRRAGARIAPPRGSQASVQRLMILISVAGSFAIGGGLGALAFGRFPHWAMTPPVIFLIWLVYRDVHIPICEIEPMQQVSEQYGEALPNAIAVFHLRKSKSRHGDVHRLPDLLSWCERLPPDLRIVILDLRAATNLDANDALELGALIRQADGRGRRIVISGVTRGQYETMIEDSGAGALDPEHLCPDLDLAIARGLAMLDEDV